MILPRYTLVGEHYMLGATGGEALPSDMAWSVFEIVLSGSSEFLVEVVK